MEYEWFDLSNKKDLNRNSGAKSTIARRKCSLERFHKRLDQAGGSVSELEDRAIEMTQSENHKERRKMNRA